MTVPAVGDPRHEHFWERRAREKEDEAAHLGAVLQQVTASLDGLRSAMLAVPMGDTMFAGVVKFNTTGFWHLDFPQPFAAVAIFNQSTAQLVVSSQQGPTAPQLGAGVARVNPVAWRVIGLRSNELTIWGPPGDTIDVEVYMRHRQPAGGPWRSA